jgi:tRNA/tmRNA/rRNA uracil-C5-methylase (TrmA/RlmC/RlmD family)
VQQHEHMLTIRKLSCNVETIVSDLGRLHQAHRQATDGQRLLAPAGTPRRLLA